MPPHLRNGGGSPFPTPFNDAGGPGVHAPAYRGGFSRGGGGYDGGRRYGGGQPRGGGWGSAGADDRDPFAEDKARKQEVDALFQNENTGINFDAYEDIPVRYIEGFLSWRATSSFWRLLKNTVCQGTYHASVATKCWKLLNDDDGRLENALWQGKTVLYH